MELNLEHVYKSYNKGITYAVADIHKSFTPGIYGILGQNGAGKSTLMGMITDNIKADKGGIYYNNTKIQQLGEKYRAVLGYMPQQQGVYEDFTGEKFLWYMAALKGMKKREAAEKIEEMLSLVNLKEVRSRKLKSYSGGMKQRILIAQALLNDPEILIMDEPTAGLDPMERIRVRNFISEISKNKIVLLATHVVSDVESIAREILIMKQGKVVKEGTPGALIASMEGKVFDVLVSQEEKCWYETNGYQISNITFAEEKMCLRIVSDTLPQKGKVEQARATLEEVYLYEMNPTSL